MIHTLNPARNTNKPAKGRLIKARTRNSSESEWQPGKLWPLWLEAILRRIYSTPDSWVGFRRQRTRGLRTKISTPSCAVTCVMWHPFIKSNGISDCKQAGEPCSSKNVTESQLRRCIREFERGVRAGTASIFVTVGEVHSLPRQRVLNRFQRYAVVYHFSGSGRLFGARYSINSIDSFPILILTTRMRSPKTPSRCSCSSPATSICWVNTLAWLR